MFAKPQYIRGIGNPTNRLIVGTFLFATNKYTIPHSTTLKPQRTTQKQASQQTYSTYKQSKTKQQEGERMDLRKDQSMDNVSPLLIHRRSSEKWKLSSASREWNLYIEKSSMLSSSPTSCCRSQFSSSTGHIYKETGT